MTLFAILTGVFISWWLPFQQQKRAIAFFHSNNGQQHVRIGYEPIEEMPIWKQKIADWLGKDAVAKVTCANFVYPDPKSASLIAMFPSIETIQFDHVKVLNLKPLEGYSSLKVFSTFQSHYSEEDLSMVAALPNLRLAKVSDDLTDSSFADFCQSKSLRSFQLDTVQLTSLKPFKYLQRLRQLEIFISVGDRDDVVDYQEIGNLRSLEKLSVHFHLDIPNFDYSFLKRLSALKLLIIQQKLPDEIRRTIENLVPSDCDIKVGHFSDLLGPKFIPLEE